MTLRHRDVVRDQHQREVIAAVREAAHTVAAAGGTHVMLRTAEVTRVENSFAVHNGRDDTRYGTPHVPPNTFVGYSSGGRDDSVRAAFHVFRVEPERWTSLHPQMRPAPLDH